MATYDDVIKQWTPEQWQKFGSMGGVIDDKGNLGTTITPESAVAGSNPLATYGNTEGLFGLTNNTWNNLGQAAGLAGTAYNLYDNILGNKAQMYKLQKSAMQQNMANIAEDRAAHKAFQGNIGGGFNSAFGKGLAANAAKVG